MKSLVADIKSKEDALEQTRIRTRELGNQKKWLDWVGAYGESLTLIDDLPKEDKKKYLHDIKRGHSYETVYLYVDKHCRDNPLQYTVDALRAFVKEMERK